MEVSEIKLELIDMLLKTESDVILNKVRAILENKKSSIVAYSISGQSLTTKDYNKKLQKSENDFKSGNVISHANIKLKYNIS